MATSGALVRRAREAARLSQRSLARIAGVPASTVNRVEMGRVSPTVEMLERLLGAAGAQVVPALLPSLDAAVGQTGLGEADRRSLVLGVLTARHLLVDPVSALARARANLVTMADAAGAGSGTYLEAWRSLLEGPTEGVVAVLTGTDEDAVALRQVTPFAGVVPELERREALRRLRAA